MLKSTHTVALLAIPNAAWGFVADAMEEAGYDNHFVTSDGDGANTVAIDMQGIGIIPAGDSDSFINSGRLSDLMVATGEDAFRAGFEAGQTAPSGSSYCKAWGRYEVPDVIQELQGAL